MPGKARKKKQKQPTIQVIVPPSLAVWIRKKAEAESMPVSMWVRRLIEREWKHGWQRPEKEST